jgi:hypothetical protein
MGCLSFPSYPKQTPPEDAPKITIGDSIESFPELLELGSTATDIAASEGEVYTLVSAREYLVIGAYVDGNWSTPTIPQVLQFNKGKLVNIFTWKKTYEQKAVYSSSGQFSHWGNDINRPKGVELVSSPYTFILIDIESATWVTSKQDAQDIISGILKRQ